MTSTITLFKQPLASTYTLLLALALVLATAPEGRTACIFLSGSFEDGEFSPDPVLKGPCYSVRFSTQTLDADGARMHVKVAETLAGDGAGLKDVLALIPLPEGAEAGARVSFTPEFKSAPEWLSIEKAQRMYEAISRSTGQTHLLTYSGKPALLIRHFPQGWLQGKIEVVYAYEQRVKETNGLYQCATLLPPAACAKGPVGRVTLALNLRNKLPLRAIFSPTHETTVERRGVFEARVHVSAEGSEAGNEFTLLYVADEDPLGLRVLAHRAAGESEGYFMLIGNPTGSATPEQVVNKDVVFVLDTSGSMRGEKSEQTQAAVEYCLNQLHPGDRFNLITFGTEVTCFREELVATTAENITAAQAFAENAVPAGRTNISEALSKGFAGAAQAGRPRFMVFLTDGTPTAGELKSDEILKKVAELNKNGTRVFVLGVGHGVNVHLLDKLALETGGSAEYVAPEEELDVKVAALFNRLSYPVLTDVQIAYGTLPTMGVYPKKIPTLFRNSQLMLVGRYREGGKQTLAVSGKLHGKDIQYACTAEFPAQAAPAHEYVAMLWAARTIGFLLEEIRLHGENKELIEEVVRLSRRFGIVTEYTAFLIADDGRKLSEAQAVAEARRRMHEANGQQSGQWAFNQSINDKAMQHRAVASAQANAYRDRSGRTQSAENQKQVGRRVFYNKDGTWVEAEDAGQRKSRVVKLFSDEHMDLIRQNSEFAKAQELGGKMELNVGDERIKLE